MRKSLGEEPGLAKEIRLNDGSRIIIRTAEHYAVAPEVLVIVDPHGEVHHVAYRNITAIRFIKRSGGRGRRAAM